MTNLIQVHTTAGTEQEAYAIARLLVERGLAACAQVSGPVTSHYRWNGKVEESSEWQCTAKTTAAAFPAVESAIRETHSYDMPQIVAMSILLASADYAQWVADSVCAPD